MFRRLARQVGLVLSALLVALPGPAMALPSQAPPRPNPPHRRDRRSARRLQRMARHRPGRRADRRRTTAGPAAGPILVQTGDVTDRGPDSLKIIRDLQRLQREAARAGGRVVVLVGNHEAMNVTGDLRYVHPGEYAAFADRDSASRRDALYTANRAAFEAAARASRTRRCAATRSATPGSRKRRSA